MSTSSIAIVASAALLGVEPRTIEVEVDLSPGMMLFSTVGLPVGAVVEARTRVKSAMQNTGLPFPQKRVVVNLAPAHLRKEGTTYDLPIALGILMAQGEIRADALEGTLIFGELALDGRLRGVRGALPMALHARQSGFQRLIAPMENASEISAVTGISCLGAYTLSEVLDHLRGAAPLKVVSPRTIQHAQFDGQPDLREVRGQPLARRGLEIAAAGGHHLLLIGPPGVGKTMIARRLASITAPMSEQERLESAAVASVSGHADPELALAGVRPFRAPHHSASHVALVGGGNPPRPGEVALAHHGVLFLDEMPEFSRSALEALRQPLEDRHITISRASGRLRWPAQFSLLASMNPCPCGYLGHPRRACVDPPHRISAYAQKISGPLLDRLDLQVAMEIPDKGALFGSEPGEASSIVAERVAEASSRQLHRCDRLQMPLTRNADLRPAMLSMTCTMSPEGTRFFEQVFSTLDLSHRAHDRVLRVARTIADLDGSTDLEPHHIAEAVQFRPLDRDQALNGGLRR